MMTVNNDSLFIMVDSSHRLNKCSIMIHSPRNSDLIATARGASTACFAVNGFTGKSRKCGLSLFGRAKIAIHFTTATLAFLSNFQSSFKTLDHKLSSTTNRYQRLITNIHQGFLSINTSIPIINHHKPFVIDHH